MRRQDHSPDDAELPASDYASVDLEDALQQRVSLGKRLVQGAGVGLILLIMSMLFSRLAPHSLATVPITTDVIPMSIGIRSSITNGTIVVNGQIIGSRQIVGTLPVQAHLRQGKNIITLDAPPFRPHSCQIDWPGHATSKPGCTFYDNAGIGPTLEIALTAPDIPDFIQTQLQANVNAMIASMHPSLQTVVLARQYYLMGTTPQGAIMSAQATEPLDATLAFVPHFDDIGGVPIENSLPSGDHEWNVEIGITQNWRFATRTGQIVGGGELPQDHEVVSINYHYNALGIQSEDSTALLTTQQLQNLVCNGIYQQVDAQLSAINQLNQWSYDNPLFKGVEGCEMHLARFASANHATLPNSPAAGKMSFLYRFGVLLAVDSEAHQLMPALPVAPAAEVAAFGN